MQLRYGHAIHDPKWMRVVARRTNRGGNSGHGRRRHTRRLRHTRPRRAVSGTDPARREPVMKAVICGAALRLLGLPGAAALIRAAITPAEPKSLITPSTPQQ
jgi:hypothetical protein